MLAMEAKAHALLEYYELFQAQLLAVVVSNPTLSGIIALISKVSNENTIFCSGLRIQGTNHEPLLVEVSICLEIHVERLEQEICTESPNLVFFLF